MSDGMTTDVSTWPVVSLGVDVVVAMRISAATIATPYRRGVALGRHSVGRRDEDRRWFS